MSAYSDGAVYTNGQVYHDGAVYANGQVYGVVGALPQLTDETGTGLTTEAADPLTTES